MGKRDVRVVVGMVDEETAAVFPYLFPVEFSAGKCFYAFPILVVYLAAYS